MKDAPFPRTYIWCSMITIQSAIFAEHANKAGLEVTKATADVKEMKSSRKNS